MDGVLLAGGLASRLGPITKVTNKHLLPIYDKPMIFYGIETLRDLGCDRIIIILGGNSVGDIVNLVRDGSQFGVEIVYKFQHEPKGISHAIYSARDILEDEDDVSFRNFLVLLGDNIFSNGSSIKGFIEHWKYKRYYAIFLYESDKPHEYGQPIFKEGPEIEIERFVEKSIEPDHKKIVTGLYGLTTEVFFDIEKQKPSKRGELEITDTLTAHLPKVVAYDYEGFWSDCGTPEGLVLASQFFAQKKENQNGNNN